MNEHSELIRKKALFYKNQEIVVHISKTNKWFHNGIIVEIQEDLLILNDEVEGDMPIFFEEIVDIEKRKEEKEDE